MKIRKPKSAVPPIVVRSDQGTTEVAWRRLATELEPVSAIMNRLGLTAAGYKIAQQGRFDIRPDALSIDPATAERLSLAREAIREEARRSGVFWTLPNAALVFGLLAVDLFGDGKPGKPLDHKSYSDVRLIMVAEVEEGRWQLVA